MRALLKAARSTISLGSSKSSTAIQKVQVVSGESGQEQEGDPETRSPVRAGKKPAGPSGAWAKASAGSPEGKATVASSETKASSAANEESTEMQNKPSGEASAASPEHKTSAAADKALTGHSATQASQNPTADVGFEMSDLEDEEPPKHMLKKTVAFAQDVQEGYNNRAQDRERWLASLGDTNGLGQAPQPTHVTAVVRAPMEWQQQRQQELPGMLHERTMLPMKELRRARLGGNSRADVIVEEEAPAAIPAAKAFVPLREPVEVFTEQLKKWNLGMKKVDEIADAPLTGNVRVTWSFGPIR